PSRNGRARHGEPRRRRVRGPRRGPRRLDRARRPRALRRKRGRAQPHRVRRLGRSGRGADVGTMRTFHRLSGQKKLAGVCAGLGASFEIDPVFFPLFFLVSLFFGGLGALIYVLLWIMAPEKPGAEPAPGSGKGLHLSRSNRKIAGVCGGLGEWLDVDPVFLRVAFVLFALLFGLGIVVYIVLWLFVPRAPAN